MASLDLRPAKGSILYEFLRLGLVFDHSDDGTAQTWFNYQAGLRADITGTDADQVTFTDTTTHLPTVVPVSKLEAIDSVLTWQSDNPLDTTTESGGGDTQTGSSQPAGK